MLNKCEICFCAALGGISFSALASETNVYRKADSPNNILFVIFDDLRPEIGCYGNPHMVTPNMDALAEDGVVFHRAYVQQAVSAASRASFLTGCRPDVTGTDYPYSVYFVEKFLPEHPSIQKYLYDNGFYTRTFGKIHHGMKEDFSQPHFSPKERAYATEDNLYRMSLDKRLCPPFESADVPDEAYYDGQIAREVVHTIHNLKNENKDNKPFFLSVGFHKPHLPFVAPKKYHDLYDLNTVPVSPNPQHTQDVSPFSEAHSGLSHWAGEKDNKTEVVSEGRQRQLRKAYFASVSFVDAQLGKIIDALKEEGLYENTAIVMIGDHGWHLGDNGMYGKSTNFERATNAPLIIRVSDKKAVRGYHSYSLTEFVDIYPTICELAGINVPEYVEGTSLLPLIRMPSRAWKNAAFSQFPRGAEIEGYSVRTNHYRYVEWVNKTKNEVIYRELFNHCSDSTEAINVAGTNSEIVSEMSEILHKGWKKALPKGIKNNSHNKLAPPFVGWGDEGRRRAKDAENKFSLIDENATVETQNLYKKLVAMTKDDSGILFGHHLSNYCGRTFDSPDPVTPKSDVYSVTGDFPAVFGFDFGRGFDKIMPYVKQAAAMGGIVTCSYHMPSQYGSVYWQKSNVLKPKNIVKELLPGGKNHDFLCSRLDEIAEFASKAVLYGKKIPIIFRPYHEHTGGWFWWGSQTSTPEEFVQLWIFTVTYLRDIKKVDNFIYAYSPSKPADYGGYETRNPGPSWFDIAGFDAYSTSDDYSSRFLEHTRLVVEYATAHNKIAACTEFGFKHGIRFSKLTDWYTREFLKPLKESGYLSSLAYCLTWGGSWIPTKNEIQYEDFIKFFEDDDVYFLNEYLNK